MSRSAMQAASMMLGGGGSSIRIGGLSSLAKYLFAFSVVGSTLKNLQRHKFLISPSSR